jgi:hypothetical protein
MRWKPLVSIACSLVSIGVQSIGLARASIAAGIAAAGARVARSAVGFVDVVCASAFPLALVAVLLAVLAWPKESPCVRVPVACLSFGAVLWSLVIV